MTVTLYWWYLPIIIVIAGIIGYLMDNSYGYLSKMAGTLWMVLCVVSAIAVIIGHLI
jgi:hypothetical protein